ncbi:MAG: hypothetical protein HY240_04040 [Actinobacteria bacterium]|nr:hypothetical protein [Actinomycetota bacterium]
MSGERAQIEERPAKSAARQRRATILLVALRVVVAIMMIVHARTEQVPYDEVQRFEQIATSPGTPYRDFPVEYAPLELAFVLAIGGSGLAATATRLIVVALASDLATAAIIARIWGSRARLSYLALGMPLFLVMYIRFDAVTVLLATASLALLRRGRDRGAPLQHAGGTLRIGRIAGWARPVLGALTASLIAATWRRARDRPLPEGRAALTAVATLLVLSPLFSVQYVLWLIPWAAIAGTQADGRRSERVTFAIALLTGTLWFIYGYGQATHLYVLLIKILLVARDGLCVALAADWLLGASPSRAGGLEEPVTNLAG